MMRGVRWIGGREFLLAGRHALRVDAARSAEQLREEWEIVHVRKGHYVFSCWVHGRRTGLQSANAEKPQTVETPERSANI
jgi:hypothetical protein